MVAIMMTRGLFWKEAHSAGVRGREGAQGADGGIPRRRLAPPALCRTLASESFARVGGRVRKCLVSKWHVVMKMSEGRDKRRDDVCHQHLFLSAL